MSAPFNSTNEMIVLAKRNLPADEWDYLNGAAESETTLRRNRLALDSIAFRPRVLRDVRKIDLSTNLLGADMTMPVMLAPIGGLHRFTKNGPLDVDTAAKERGVINFLSTVSETPLEDVAANSLHKKVFQIYVRGDNKWLSDFCKQIVKAGFWGVALTVDSAFYGNRERLNAHQLQMRRVPARDHQKAVTWDTVKLIQDIIDDKPLFVKGVMTAEDAALCVEHRVSCVYVSNHGGRQLDHVLGNIETLPEIMKAVNGKAPVVIDGGFYRGTDIIKAIAMGAKAVGIGRLQGWALGAGGAAGLIRLLDLLKSELEISMGLVGATKFADLNPSYIAPAAPVRFAHEHSAFPHLPSDRIV